MEGPNDQWNLNFRFQSVEDSRSGLLQPLQGVGGGGGRDGGGEGEGEEGELKRKLSILLIFIPNFFHI